MQEDSCSTSYERGSRDAIARFGSANASACLRAFAIRQCSQGSKTPGCVGRAPSPAFCYFEYFSYIKSSTQLVNVVVTTAHRRLYLCEMLRPVARPRNLHVLCLLGIVILVSTPVTPQESQPPATTFSSSSELVLVPTVVNDKSGAHISGLTKQDFVLKQDGKVRSIAVFEEVRTDSARVRRSRGEGGIFNNFESDGTYHRLIIIVLDLINTPLADQASAKEALVKFLLETAESGEPVCLLALTRGGLHLVHDFTDNPKLLAEALRKVQSNTAPLIPSQNVEAAHPVGDGLAATLTKLIRGELQAESQLASLERKDTALITVQGLQQIAKAFRGLPGRKALIWASSGFPFSLSPPSSLLCEPACPAEQRGDVQSAYDNAWRMMNDAQTAVYPVDLRSTDVGIRWRQKVLSLIPMMSETLSLTPPPKPSGNGRTRPAHSSCLRKTPEE